ncbi:low molecular weight phosphotyrosine protein phosphatase [Caballeronia sp. NK8]|uniref:low molecular weight protein-tyrosine-phosphatase n=1 Tax=Caballeronia sp. NK8 TaxID=140098 RepID=UPI001BB7E1B4|nr:low molecular weight protein-tyrosine-phosphatase [Caballeronia sp. NK8]BCQ24506.1 low molecular weight phosphotyrosine protein phosphatase [Caballeronia sp. NK8]
MIGSVLMVCEGNICRSPLAAALLKRELPQLEVGSAGTHALVGARADAIVAELAHERGIALDTHVATQLDAPRARAADLILTMTKPQREWIETAFPSTRGKVFRLCDEHGADVTDPYRRHRAVFDLAFAQIREGISQWTRTLAAQR